MDVRSAACRDGSCEAGEDFCSEVVDRIWPQITCAAASRGARPELREPPVDSKSTVTEWMELVTGPPVLAANWVIR